MDSRSKIAAETDCGARLAELQATGRGVRVVSGYFDPLLAWHAERLEELRAGGGRLAVMILDPPDPILPARARAELVAALGAVDLVLIPPTGAAVTAQVCLEETDAAVRRQFVQHVRERQS